MKIMIDYTDAENKLNELIYAVETATSPHPLYYFAPTGMLKAALEYFEDSEVVVVDNKWNMWQRGNKLKEKFGDNDK